MTFREDLLPVVSELQGIAGPDCLDVRTNSVYLVTRKWTGPEVGVGTYSDTETEILPRPMVREVGAGRELVIAPVLPQFVDPAGGYTVRQINPIEPPGNTSTEFLYRVRGPNAGLYCLTRFDASRPFRYTLEVAALDRRFPLPLPFVPTDIASLTGWWDATTGPVIDPDGRVSVWKDRSEYAFDAGAPATERRALYVDSVAALNNQPALLFAATSNADPNAAMYLATTFAAGAEFTMVAVADLATMVGLSASTLASDATPPTPTIRGVQVGPDYIWQAATGVGGGINDGIIDAAPHIFTVTAEAALGKLRIDGADVASTAGAGQPWDGLVIGGGPTADQYGWNGHIAELIFYNETLGDEARDKVEAYLSIKYGITI